MTRADRATGSMNDEARAQKRIARKYRTLGYDVVERPAPDHLPEFMRDTTPDLVARSESDNVVIEIKRHAGLKGSNDLVGLAERVSGRPGWRFELVVLADDEKPRRVDYTPLIDRSREVATAGLTDAAFMILAQVLSEIIRDVAAIQGLSPKRRTWLADVSTERVIDELGFLGVLPAALVDRCLAALDLRNRFVHHELGRKYLTRSDCEELENICKELQLFIWR